MSNVNYEENLDNDHYKIIVNYLPQSLTDNEFRKIFERIGPVAQAKIVRNKNSYYSFGFGFIDFINKSDAEKAISQLNGLQLKNKRIKVAWSRPGNDEIKKAKLYIKNVPDISVEALNQVFEKYGEIIQSNIIQSNTVLNKNKGIAFILYDKREQAQNAIDNLQGVLLPGSSLPLEIKFAFTSNNGVKFQNQNNSRPQQMRPYNNHHYQNNHQNNNFNNNQNFNNNNQNFNNYNNHNNRLPRNYQQSNNYYSNNNYDEMDDESAGNSNMYRGQIHNTQYKNKTHYTNRYNPMNPSSSSSRSYDDSYKSGDYSEPNRNYHQQNYHSNNYQHQNQNYNSHHRNYQNYQNAPGDEQVGHTIFVYNIGMITEGHLVSLFSKFGQVIKCNVFRNKKFAFVCMAKYENAVNAIQNLNNNIVSGNKIQVSFKK